MRVVVGVVGGLVVGSARDMQVHQAQRAGLPVPVADPADYEFDSEHFDHFTCCVDNLTVEGVFRSVRFSNGERVKVVVGATGGDCLALLSLDTGLLYATISVDSGNRQRLLDSAKLPSIAMSVFIAAFMVIMAFSLPMQQFLVSAALSLAAGIVFVAVWVLWDYFASARPLAMVNTEVFRLLGFKRPEWVKLAKYSLLRRKGDLKGEWIYEVDELLPAKP